jgi:2-dehydropantoate 2-reductase
VANWSEKNNMPLETKTSFQRDFEQKGKLNEGDLFGGTIIRFGKELNLPTRTTEEIFHILNMRLNTHFSMKIKE